MGDELNLACDEEMLSPSDSPSAIPATVLPSTSKEDDILKTIRELREPFDEMLPAMIDPVISKDPRVLKGMLALERYRRKAPFRSFKTVQKHITAEMRNTVTTWMYEVCNEEQMTDNVFMRAVDLMDRFLRRVSIKGEEFQLLASVCLFISSKLSGTCFSAEKLSTYTGDSCSASLILSWELAILGLLEWDTFTVTPCDFLQILIAHLPSSSWNAKRVYETSQTCVAYCATDLEFESFLPSTIASACIAAPLKSKVTRDTYLKLLESLHKLTYIEMDHLRQCIDKVKRAFEKATNNNTLEKYPPVTCTVTSEHQNATTLESLTTTERMDCGPTKFGEINHSLSHDVGNIINI